MKLAFSWYFQKGYELALAALLLHLAAVLSSDTGCTATGVKKWTPKRLSSKTRDTHFAFYGSY